MSAIVLTVDGHDGKPPIVRVISIGTGSKCLCASRMNKEGKLLGDSHAEVIARRGCMKWMMDQLSLCMSLYLVNKDLEEENLHFILSERVKPIDDEKMKRGGENLENEEKSTYKFQLKSNRRFHLYTSQAPCGDASIFPLDDIIKEETTSILPMISNEKDLVKVEGEKVINEKKRKRENELIEEEGEMDNIINKKRTFSNGVNKDNRTPSHDGFNRTGAKLVERESNIILTLCIYYLNLIYIYIYIYPYHF